MMKSNVAGNVHGAHADPPQLTDDELDAMPVTNVKLGDFGAEEPRKDEIEPYVCQCKGDVCIHSQEPD
jgi:hypothetical protein